MNLIKWQPTEDMRDFSNLLERSFQRSAYPRRSVGPQLSLDIFETEESIVLRAALPGAKKEDISVELEDQILTVSATVAPPELPEGAKSLLQESTFGKVSRSLKIAHPLDVEASKGTFDQGVLEVTFPKKPEARRKSITIE